MRDAKKRALAALRLFGRPPTYFKVRLRASSRRAPCDHALFRVPLAVFLLFASLSLAGLAPAQEDTENLAAARHDLMPVPAEVVFQGEPLALGRDFSVAVVGPEGGVEPRVERAALRFLERLGRQTGIPIVVRLAPDVKDAPMVIAYDEAVGEVQQPVEDESYEIVVGPDGVELHAATPYGVLRGLETVLQLVELVPPPAAGEAAGAGGDAGGDGAVAQARAATIADLSAEPVDFVIPGVQIRDAPRFPWRGLLLDPGRHFLSVATVKRNLDAMAAVKLNVLHWHLTEDQGFRVESKAFTGLQELGSGGLYYTQDEIRAVIAYARERGIRVMPEFDMPGHTASWFVGYPGLASAPGPYEIIATWGVHDPAMDPTRETTYELLDTFIGEMAALFPDPYFHIGGDEVNGVQWSANEDIQQFIKDNDLVDNHGLQTYFNRRIQPLLAAHDKTMMGWDEIFQPGLPAGTVVHSWRGPEGVAAAARAGYRTVLSNGYYIDLVESAARHYAVDPLGGPAADLTPDERALVLGGEATMWGEYVDDETVDSRIWPRAAAIAERLWSADVVTEIDDMYRRLAATSAWIEWTGVTHRSYQQPMLERLAGDGPAAPLLTLDEVLEPLKGYRRGGTRKYTRFTPLNRLVDATPPESETARRFARMVEDYLAVDGDTSNAAMLAALRDQLTVWRDNHERLVPLARGSVMLPEAEALSAQLRVVAELGLAALADLEAEPRTVSEQTGARRVALDEAEQSHGALQITVVAPVRRLVEAAGKPLW